MRKTWKKALAGLCAVAVLMTGVNWPVMTVNAEETSTTNVLLDESVKIVEYTGASSEGGGFNKDTIGGVISAEDPDTNGSSGSKWVSGSVLKRDTNGTVIENAVTYIVIDLGENVDATAESIELYWFNGAYGNNYKIETSDNYVVPENPDAMTRNNLEVGKGKFDSILTTSADYNNGTWTTVAEMTQNRSGASYVSSATVKDTISVDEANQQLGRYVRLSVTTMNPVAGYMSTALRKIRIYGTRTAVSESNYEAKLSALSVTLDGSIGVNYKMTATETLADDAYMQFKVGGNTSVVKVSEAEVDSKGRYVFTCEVCAPEMTKTIVAQMFNADGTVISAETEYSVQYYANQMLTKFGDIETYKELVALLKAMLNYGAYAQTQFNVNTSVLANENLADADKDVSSVTAESITVKGYSYDESIGDIVGNASLILNSRTDFRQYINADSLVGYTFTLSDTSKTLDKGVDSEKGAYVQLSNIPAAELDNEYVLTIDNGTVSGAIYCSPLNYVQNVLGKTEYEGTSLADVAKALYLYNVAANTYFE